jgi:hypothetical protein
MVHDDQNGLPGPNDPIHYDAGPFITSGLGPAGQKVQYYNFDVQPISPKPVYAFFYEASGEAVAGQANILGVIPGDAGYTDFWQLNKVIVPATYVPNSVTSEQGILDQGYRVDPQDLVINCPVVPEGSTASLRLGGGTAALQQGWYNDTVVFYFLFEEKELRLAGGTVPISPIYVTFNINPDLPGGGPASGFTVEPGTVQTHNVLATVPSDASYSPLWSVNVYDNANFSMVSDLATAHASTILATSVAMVNCPVVFVE